MRELIFPGTYRDARGTEDLTWRLCPVPGQDSPNGPGAGGFEFSCRVRGIELRSRSVEDFEIEAADRPAAVSAGLTILGDVVTDCVLAGEMPFALSINGVRETVALSFEIDQHHAEKRYDIIRFRLPTPAGTYEVTDENFEDALERIHAALDPSIKLDCCLKCRWSAYQMYFQPTIGMSCNRDAPREHLAARTKHEIARVPLTEFVPETYLCDRFQRHESLREDRIGGVTLHPASAGNDG